MLVCRLADLTATFHDRNGTLNINPNTYILAAFPVVQTKAEVLFGTSEQIFTFLPNITPYIHTLNLLKLLFMQQKEN